MKKVLHVADFTLRDVLVGLGIILGAYEITLNAYAAIKVGGAGKNGSTVAVRRSYTNFLTLLTYLLFGCKEKTSCTIYMSLLPSWIGLNETDALISFFTTIVYFLGCFV